MTSAPLFLGVDGGATRCRARLRDADGAADRATVWVPAGVTCWPWPAPLGAAAVASAFSFR